MKYRVLRFFIDRDSLKEFNAGDLFPCENLERANELVNKCYIERVQEDVPVQEDKAPAKKEPTKTAKAKSTTKKTATKTKKA